MPGREMLASHTGGLLWEISTREMAQMPRKSPETEGILNDQLKHQHLHSTPPTIPYPTAAGLLLCLRQTSCSGQGSSEKPGMAQGRRKAKSWLCITRALHSRSTVPGPSSLLIRRSPEPWLCWGLLRYVAIHPLCRPTQGTLPGTGQAQEPRYNPRKHDLRHSPTAVISPCLPGAQTTALAVHRGVRICSWSICELIDALC